MTGLDKLTASLKKKLSGTTGGVYLISGTEEYFISAAINFMTDKVVPENEREFNLDVMDGTDADPDSVLSAMLSFPIVGTRRLTIVKRFDKMEKKARLEITEHLPKLPESNIVALIAGEIKLTEEPYRTIVSLGEHVTFNKLRGAELTEFLIDFSGSLEKKLDREDAELLVELTGDSVGDLVSEVEKLSLYVGEKKRFETDDIKLSVGKSRTFNIFELQRAIGQRDPGRAQEIAGRMLEAGEKAIYINYMLTRFFLHLLQIKHLLEKRTTTNEISTKVFGRWNPFMNEYVAAAKAFAFQEIEKSLRTLLDADAKLKNGGYREPEAVVMVVAEVAGTK